MRPDRRVAALVAAGDPKAAFRSSGTVIGMDAVWQAIAEVPYLFVVIAVVVLAVVGRGVP